MSDTRENKNQMVVLIQPQKISIQIRSNQSNYMKHFETFNLEFIHDEYRDDVMTFRGFAMCSIYDYHIFSTYEDRTIKTLNMVSRKLKDKFNIEQPLANVLSMLIKTFNVKLSQVNVNSNFSDGALSPVTTQTIINIIDATKIHKLPQVVR